MRIADGARGIAKKVKENPRKVIASASASSNPTPTPPAPAPITTTPPPVTPGPTPTPAPVPKPNPKPAPRIECAKNVRYVPRSSFAFEDFSHYKPDRVFLAQLNNSKVREIVQKVSDGRKLVDSSIHRRAGPIKR